MKFSHICYSIRSFIVSEDIRTILVVLMCLFLGGIFVFCSIKIINETFDRMVEEQESTAFSAYCKITMNPYGLTAKEFILAKKTGLLFQVNTNSIQGVER